MERSKTYEPDAMWESYIGWSPYHYSMNDPVNMLDWDGFTVIAKSQSAQRAVRSSVEGKYEHLVIFKKDGSVDYDNIVDNIDIDIYSKEHQNTNIAILARMAENEQVVTVEVTPFFYFQDREGNEGKKHFFLSQTGQGDFNYGGYTLPPLTSLNITLNEPNDMFSITSNIEVYISSNRSEKGNIDVYTAHELLGHARFMMMKKTSAHVDPPYMFLENSIKRAEDNATK